MQRRSVVRGAILATALASSACPKSSGSDGSATEGPPPTDAAPRWKAQFTNNVETGPAKWTVMVYLNAYNDLEPYSLENFAQMANVGSTDAVNVVVFYGRSAWSHAYRIRVTTDSKAVGSAPTGGDIVDAGSPDFGRVETLDAFVRDAEAAYPASKFALVIWDHADGFNAYEYALPLNLVSRPDNLDLDGDGIIDVGPSGDERTLWGISYGRNGGHLNINDVETVVNNRHVNLVGFDACLMGMVEATYALRSAEVVIGSEELVPLTGWPYEQSLRAWNASAIAKPADLGHSLVDAYSARYADPPPGKTFTLDSVDVAGMMTNSVPSAITALATALRNAIPNAKKLGEIQSARASCCEYDPSAFDGGFRKYQHIDLGELCNQLIGWSNDRVIVGAAKKLRQALASVNYPSASWDRSVPGYRSSGLAIYFPANAGIYARDRASGLGDLYEPGNPKALDFVRNRIGWAEFLEAYLAKTSSSVEAACR